MNADQIEADATDRKWERLEDREFLAEVVLELRDPIQRLVEILRGLYFGRDDMQDAAI